MKTIRFLSNIQPLLLAAAFGVGALGCSAAADLGSAEDETAGGDNVAATSQALLCSADKVPLMTGPTAVNGQVISSGAYGTAYEAWQAFDGSDSSMWISALQQTPASIGYQFSDGAKTVSHYAIKYVNGSITTRAPRLWTFEGWNGSSWTVLDTRSNEVNWAGFERREYAVATPGAYGAYRLNIQDDNDARTGVEVISLGNLEFYECEPDGPQTHPYDWYMQQAGLPAPAEIGKTMTVPAACDIRATQGAVTFNRGVTQTCTYQHNIPGWQIIGADLEVLENQNGRGSWSQAIIAANGQFTASSKELGDKWKVAIDMAGKFGDIEAKTKLELEYQRHQETFLQYASDKNTFFLSVTANGGAFAKSAIRVRANVRLVQIL
jgi:hypothetical protein